MARAIKENVMLALDVGPTMRKTKLGDKTYLQLAQEAVRSFVEQKMLHAKKDELGVLLFGSRATKNPLAEENEGQYEHIEVLQQIDLPKLNLLKQLDSLPPGAKEGGDFIDAIVVAMDLLFRKTLNRKQNKRIVLLTDAMTAPSDAHLDAIIDKLKSDSIGLLVMGLGFADVDDEGNEVPGTGTQPDRARGITSAMIATKRENERMMRKIAADLPEGAGSVLTITEALGLLAGFRTRTVKQTSKSRFALEVGPSFRIPMYSFTKVAELKYPTFKLVNKERLDAMTPEEKVSTDVKEEIKVIRAMHYYLKDLDPGVPLADNEVARENLEYAFNYGRDRVTFHADQYRNLKYMTGERHAKLIGFTPAASIPRHYLKSGADLWSPEPGNDKAAVAVSSLARAMEERAVVAVVRFVYQKNAAVRLGALWPRIKAGHEGFIYVPLPFAEDLRDLQFDDFAADRKRAPSGEQLAAAEALISAMDLTAPPAGEEGACELFKPRHTFNPALQRLYRTLPARALDPACPVPVEDERAEKMLEPPPELLALAEKEVARFKALFPLKRIEKARKVEVDGEGATPGKRAAAAWDTADEPAAKRAAGEGGLPTTAPISSQELRIDSIMAERRSAARVTSDDPVGTFRAVIGDRTCDRVEDAVKQMSEVIVRLLESGRGGAVLHRKAADALATLREGCVANEEPRLFNDFLRRLREQCAGPEGRRRDFWQEHVVGRDLTLITADEASGEVGGVSAEEALEFIGKQAKREAAAAPAAAAPKEEEAAKEAAKEGAEEEEENIGMDGMMDML